MKPIVIANWKANKTLAAAKDWASAVKAETGNSLNRVEVVVCPAYVAIPALAEAFLKTELRLGAQNVSEYPEGAFTGEVTATMLKSFISHCIVGHSERRRLFHENSEEVMGKVKRLLEEKITPVLCVADLDQLEEYLQLDQTLADQAEEIIFVYEPPSAISGGGDYHPQTPSEAEVNCQKFSEKIGKSVITLYGGSVSEADVASFLTQKNINGVLVGKASLEAKSFVSLVKAVSGAVL